MTTVIKGCKGQKKKRRKKNRWTQKILMIPDSEISECPEHEVKSKIGNIFFNEKMLEKYSVKIYETNPYFYEHYGKEYKLMKMGINIYYLELMFSLLNISQPWKLIKKVILTKALFFRRKDKKHQKKNLVVDLSELIRVKKTMMQTTKPAEYKHLSVNLKTEIKKIEQKIKRTRRQNKKFDSLNHSIKFMGKLQAIKD